MSIWREYLDYSGICSFEEGKCPCDEGYECTRCLDDDVYRNFLVFKKKRNLNTMEIQEDDEDYDADQWLEETKMNCPELL